MRRIAMLACSTLLWSCSAAGPAAPDDLSLLIAGGTIVDGTGAAAYPGDVGLTGGQIAWVGSAGAASAPDTIDATGLIVTPGFIDVHSHTTGRTITPAFRLNEGVVRQGVTTVIEGPDGYFSATEVRRLIASHDSVGIGTNFGFYVGHNGIRAEVMGDDQQRAPSADELDAMRGQVREGMELGAVGFSSGLMYEPGMFGTTSEVIEMAKEVAPFGGIYDSHVRNPVHALLESDREVVAVAEGAGIAGKIGHVKAVGLQNDGATAEIIELVEAARARGLDIVSDQYPYDGAATAPIEGIVVAPPGMDGLDAFRSLFGGGEPGPEALAAARRELGAAFADPDRWQALKEASENGIDGGFAWLKATGYTSMRVVSAPDSPELEGRYLSELAQARDQDPFRVVSDLVSGVSGPVNITLGAIREDDVRALLRMPWNMIASDGEAADGSDSPQGHPRSAGTFARLLGHYVREEGVLTLEGAVRKITSLPADFLGLADLGRLAPGNAADIAVFDAGTIIDRSDWDHPNRFAEGVVYVLVNGVVVLDRGTMSGEAPGHFVRPSR